MKRSKKKVKVPVPPFGDLDAELQEDGSWIIDLPPDVKAVSSNPDVGYIAHVSEDKKIITLEVVYPKILSDEPYIAIDK